MRIVICDVVGHGTSEDPRRPDTPSKHWQAPYGSEPEASEMLIEELD